MNDKEKDKNKENDENKENNENSENKDNENKDNENKDNKKDETIETVTKFYKDELEKLKKEIDDMKKKHADEIVDILKSGNGKPALSKEEQDVQDIINKINKGRKY